MAEKAAVADIKEKAGDSILTYTGTAMEIRSSNSCLYEFINQEEGNHERSN